MDNTDQTSLLVEQLKAHFGLHTNPFSPTLEVFYEGGQRQHNLETLRHLAIFGDMVLLLTGDKGAGKTSLIERFSKLVSSEIDVITLAARPDLLAPTSVNRLAILTGLRAIDSEPVNQTLARVIQKYDLEYQKRSKRTLVVIDDADLLPEDELDLYLAKFKALPPESGVILLLVGLPSLVEQVVDENPIGDDQWLHHIPLKPLVSSEVYEYLQLRLQAAGCVAPLVLTESQTSKLHEMGKGLPGRINRVFVGVILGQYALTVQPAKTSKLSSTVAIALVALLLISFLFVSYQHGLFEFYFDSGQPQQESNEVSKPKESPVDIALKASEERLKQLDKALEQTPSLNLFEGEPPEDIVPLDPAPEVLDLSNIEVVRADEVVADSGAIIPSPKIEEVPTIAVTPAVEATSTIAEVAVIDENTKRGSEIVVEPEAQTERQVDTGETSVAEQPPPVVLEPVVPPVQLVANETVPTPAPKLTEVSTTSRYFRSRDWVRQQPSSGLAAQVLGTYTEKSAMQFIEKAGVLEHELYYVQAALKGKPWFVVLYGQFESKSVAREAMASAPKVNANEQPWLRTFGEVLKTLPE